MRLFKRFSFLTIVFLLVTCASAQQVTITLLHINDLYELSPVAGGKEGGMARVATLHNELRKLNPNTYFVLAGDAFSPSALGTAVIDGKPLAGKQMVSVLNAIGVNFATFGNHEFDVSEDDFKARLLESKTTWFSGNVVNKDGAAFEGVRQNVAFTVHDASGVDVRVGIIGVTLDQNQKPWVKYNDYLASARAQVQALRPQVDILIALTHLAMEQDIKLAQEVAGIDIIMGGHEHENILVYRGVNYTPIAKADANVRSAYIHQFVFDTKTHHLDISSQLQRIDLHMAEDPDVRKLVDQWTEKAFAAFRKGGFEPKQLVANSPVLLDGKESDVRNHPTNLGELIADATLHEAVGSEAAFYNSGSIRIDDVLPAGSISQYDILRILPFGGKIVLAEMRGTLLERVLNAGLTNKGAGGYLQTANITRSAGGNKWLINGQPIDSARTYKIATSGFLLTGGERNIEFLNRQNPDVMHVQELGDVRFAVIKEMQKRWPAAK